MNAIAYEHIIQLLNAAGVPYTPVEHTPCRTSEESQMARAAAGYPGTVGAKALLAKLYFHQSESFATIVLPGTHVLERHKLLAQVPGLKKMRFASVEELADLAGVVPGCMPPFAKPIFPHIELLIVALALKAFPQLGFNAAYLEKSIILSPDAYFAAVTPDYLLDCSVPKV